MKNLTSYIIIISCFILVGSCLGDGNNPANDSNTPSTQTPAIAPGSNTSSPTTNNSATPAVPLVLPEIEGYAYFNDVAVESFPPSNQDPNRFNADNKIYKPGRVFTYGYYYESVNGQRLLAQNLVTDSIPINRAWQFVLGDQVNTMTITDFLFTVQEGMGILGKVRSDYARTTVEVNYDMPSGRGSFKEYTGLIENPLGVWIYPPRLKVFGILAISPQPFIKAPYEVGNQWEWGFSTGAAYSDSRWIQWGNQVITNCRYKIIDKKMVETPIGQLECFEINSFGESRLGKTQLTSYFNEEYGFVKMNYLNIDGSKMIILIKEVKEPS